MIAITTSNSTKVKPWDFLILKVICKTLNENGNGNENEVGTME